MNTEQTETACNLLKSFVEFAEHQDNRGLIDGSYDPELTVIRAKNFIIENCYFNSDNKFALEA